MMKILHLIAGLNTGGAEMMLYKMLSSQDRASFNPEVVSLTDIGPIGERILKLGITIRCLGMKRGIPNPLAVLKLATWLRHSKPAVIQTWMYHADLVGGIAAKWAGGIPLAWGIRHSNLESGSNKWSTILTAKICARSSRWLPAKIVCCSEVSRQVHAGIGYAPEKMVVIPNGFDLDTFRPDHGARITVRRELGIQNEAPLIGLVGRFDPQKDYHNFIMAAARISASHPDPHFLLCGDCIDAQNAELTRWIAEAGLSERFHLLGRRVDIPRLTAALDIAASSSAFGEGFPNVIGEAMACGVPCVATDVGDSARIIGDTGRVVPTRNPDAFAMALSKLLNLSPQARMELGQQARQRIKEKYSLAHITKQYEALYTEVVLQHSLIYSR
jgi:glycosyltransferase involved in cell wall biosynthesis